MKKTIGGINKYESRQRKKGKAKANQYAARYEKYIAGIHWDIPCYCGRIYCNALLETVFARQQHKIAARNGKGKPEHACAAQSANGYSPDKGTGNKTGNFRRISCRLSVGRNETQTNQGLL